MKLFWILLLIGAALFIYGGYRNGDTTSNVCVVTHKMTEVSGHKSTKTNYLLVVNIPARHLATTVLVTPTTWANSSVGDRITFELDEHTITGKSPYQYYVLIGLVIMGITVFVGFTRMLNAAFAGL